MKIYTKTGDAGQTGLFGGGRVAKNNLRVEAYGSLDELNAFVGLLRDSLTDPVYRNTLKDVQDRLFTLGAHLASGSGKNMLPPDIRETDMEELEKQMDRMDEALPRLKNFILPGGAVVVSYCHIARTVCRRAERMAVALNGQESVDPLALKYLNRLSDYFFVLSRKIALDLGIEEIVWKGRGRP